MNLFSPQNRDYSVAVVPISPDRAAPTDPKAVVTPPPDNSHKALVWAGVLVAFLFVASLTLYLCR